MKRFSVLLILTLTVCFAYSQDTAIIKKEKDTTAAFTNKSVDIGISPPISIDSRTPGLALTPNINFNISRHQFQLGLDIYETAIRKIFGYQVAYKYLFFDERKKMNLFADLNLQYVQYAAGAALHVPYNYLPTDDYHNLIQIKSLINTLGIGLSATFLKRCAVILVVGGGYNYSKLNYSSTNTTKMGIYTYNIEDNVNPILYGRLGIAYKIWKEHSK